jgi:ribosomal protein S27AE
MRECPECGAKIIWGLPDAEKLRSVEIEPDEVVFAGCCILDENFCPACGALVFTAAEAFL